MTVSLLAPEVATVSLLAPEVATVSFDHRPRGFNAGGKPGAGVWLVVSEEISKTSRNLSYFRGHEGREVVVGVSLAPRRTDPGGRVKGRQKTPSSSVSWIRPSWGRSVDNLAARPRSGDGLVARPRSGGGLAARPRSGDGLVALPRSGDGYLGTARLVAMVSGCGHEGRDVDDLGHPGGNGLVADGTDDTGGRVRAQSKTLLPRFPKTARVGVERPRLLPNRPQKPLQSVPGVIR